ncbi:MAG: DUF2442 domain-containing protein [Cyanothece sp. SIO1E1]|nr:DUF2442 domain-containing protein [Cyanothece sp. SIO1E1]
MYWKVTDVKYEKDYTLLLTFYNGAHKRIDLKPYLKGPVFVPLLDIEYFKKVRIEGSSVAWPNGADFAPEFLFEKGQVFTPDEHVTIKA